MANTPWSDEWTSEARREECRNRLIAEAGYLLQQAAHLELLLGYSPQVRKLRTRAMYFLGWGLK